MHTKNQACDKSVLEAIMRCSSTTPTKFSNAVAKAQNEMTSPVDLVGKNKELLCPRLPQPLNKSAEGSPDQLIGCVPQCHLGLVSCNATSVWHPSTPGTVHKAYYSLERHWPYSQLPSLCYNLLLAEEYLCCVVSGELMISKVTSF